MLYSSCILWAYLKTCWQFLSFQSFPPELLLTDSCFWRQWRPNRGQSRCGLNGPDASVALTCCWCLTFDVDYDPTYRQVLVSVSIPNYLFTDEKPEYVEDTFFFIINILRKVVRCKEYAHPKHLHFAWNKCIYGDLKKKSFNFSLVTDLFDILIYFKRMLCPSLVCPKQRFTLLSMTDEPESPACRSLLLFIDTGFSTSCYWPQTSSESRIHAHQSGLRLICQPLQQDKTLFLTMGSVMEGPAW